MLGVGVIGRDFSPEDDQPGAAPVAIVSDRLWRSSFGAARDLVGTTLSTSYVPLQVIGIAPADFRGARLGEQIDLWIPRELVLRTSNLTPVIAAGARRSFMEEMMPLVGLARLRPGVTSADAERAISQPDARIIVRPLADVFGTPNRPTVVMQKQTVIRVLGATAALVLIAGCTTLMALVLVHYERRRQEFAVRLALGASHSQLLRRLGAELLGLAVIGATSAMAITAAAVRALPALSLPDGVDLGRLDLTFDWRVTAVGAVAAVFALAAAATVPALRFSRPNLVADLISSATTGAPSSLRLRRVMLGLHAAMTIIVLVAAGLFVRTVVYGFGRGPGFDVDRTVFMEIQPSTGEFWDKTEGTTGADARKAAAYHRLFDELRGLPGVEVVTFGSSPLRPDVTSPVPTRDLTVDGFTRQMPLLMSDGASDYLETLNSRVTAGRLLAAGDAVTVGVRPAVVTASLAANLWPASSGIGRQFNVATTAYEVVGVVGDIVCNSLRSEPCGRVFTASSEDPIAKGVSVSVTLKTRRNAAGLVERATRIASNIFPTASRLEVRSGGDLVAHDLGQQRLGLWFFSGFGLVVLALGLGGVFGLVAYLAESKRREFGLRMALGATYAHVLRRVVGAGLWPVAVGTLVGLAAAALLARSLATMLVGVTRLDPASYAGAAGIMIGGALVGGLTGAWRIRRLSPMEVLRRE